MKDAIFYISKTFKIIIVLSVILSCTQSQHSYNVPDFNLTDIFGNYVSLYDILDNGQNVLIVTWALWTKQSIKELDTLLFYTNEIKSLNIQTLAINMDTKRSVPSILPFVIEHRWVYHYCVLLDTTKIFRNLYNIQTIPTTIVIDRNGNICFNWLGYKSGDEKIIVDTLKEMFSD